MKRKPIYILLFLLVFLGVTSLAFAEEYTFSNMSGITINDNSAATPYPSGINIPDDTIPGNVTDVTVTLHNVTHPNPDDIRALLVSPSTAEFVLFMAKAGGTNAITDVTLTFDDSATAPLTDTGQIISGVYQPSVFGGAEGQDFPDTPNVTPDSPYPTTLSVTFDGLNSNTNLNDAWTLFVWDDTATNSGSIGGWSLTIYDDTDACEGSLIPTLSDPPDNATNVSVIPLLDFEPVVNSILYYVGELCSDDDCDHIIQTEILATTQWQVSEDDGLVGGTPYWWRVRTTSTECGGSDWSQIWKFTTTGTCTVPGTPGQISPTNGAGNQSTTPTLQWGAVSGADTYNVQVCTAPGCGTIVASVSGLGATQWTVSPALNQGQTYYWQVSATNACGTGTPSGTWSFTTQGGCPLPGTPSLISPTNGATNQSATPTLDWSDVSGSPTSYNVRVCSDSNCNNVVASGSVATSQWTVSTPLNQGQTYWWDVYANNACGSGSPSARWSFTVSCQAPGVPSLINPANNAPDVSQSPTLDWNDVSGASTYNVRVCNDSACTSVIRSQSGLTTSQWTVTPALTEGAVVWWQAQAANACDTSAWSTAWTFTVCTPPGSPTQLSPAAGSMFVSPTPTLDWADASGATSYTVELCGDSACTTVWDTETVTNSQLTISQAWPLSLGVQHWWRVSANTGCGSSPWTGTWDFITSLTPRIMDVNGDMMPDILWQHDVRSDIYVWYMNGINVIGGESLGTVTDPDWRIVNADHFGSADILWQHLTRGDLSIWWMDGINIIGEDDIGRVSDPDWLIVSTEDFDGDGNLDFLWQHQLRADIYIWFMDDNIDWLDSLSMGTVSDKSWKIVGTADFNGDYKPDILWQHALRGDVYIWFMDGVTFLDGKHIGTVADTNWQIKGTDDYNGDLNADILWQNILTGETSVWLMLNDEIVAISDIAIIDDPDWMIVAPK